MEQTRGTLNKKLTLFIGYYRYIGIVKKLLMHYSRTSERWSFNATGEASEIADAGPGTNGDVDHGYFEEPNYQRLGRLDITKRKELLKSLVTLVCDCYDTEWWYIILQRAIFLQKKGNWNTDIEYPKEKKHFPRTKGEFRTWISLLGGDSFMSQSDAFTMGQAQVSDKSDITILMIRDLTNKLPSNSKSRWMQCVTRHLAHYIIEEMGKIRDVSLQSLRECWSIFTFEEALALSFCTGRRNADDTTPAIIWPTVPDSKMIRWRGFGPRIVEYNRNPIPTTRTIVPEVVAPHARPPGKDVFFRYLRYGGGSFQFNQILVMRSLAFFETIKKRDNRGSPKLVFEDNWQKVVLPGNERLSVFWDSVPAMLNYVKDCVKLMKNKPGMDAVAKFNEHFWVGRGNTAKDVELFHYRPDDNDLCDNGFKPSGNHEAFRQAHRGIITEKFLTKLIEWRKFYVKKRFLLVKENHTQEVFQDLAKILQESYNTEEV
jgi:hypothetical protein